MERFIPDQKVDVLRGARPAAVRVRAERTDQSVTEVASIPAARPLEPPHVFGIPELRRYGCLRRTHAPEALQEIATLLHTLQGEPIGSFVRRGDVPEIAPDAIG